MDLSLSTSSIPPHFSRDPETETKTKIETVPSAPTLLAIRMYFYKGFGSLSDIIERNLYSFEIRFADGDDAACASGSSDHKQ
jgi:hypothetical protein